MKIKCFLFGHKWEMNRIPFKKGNFISGWSPVYYYEKCCVCGRERNNSPFSKKLTEKIEKTNIMGKKILERIK